MLIPFLLEELAALLHQLPQPVQFSRALAYGPVQFHGRKPELGVVVRGFHVYMRRLAGLIAEKEKAMSIHP
jgi:hypothetical protein